MSNNMTLTGTLQAGPQGSCEGGFPAGLLQLTFGLSGSCPGSKPAPAKFWTNATINSAAAFVPLKGIGVGEAVTQANFLYLRTSAPMVLRMTFVDPTGGPDLVLTGDQLFGLKIQEFPNNGYLKLLEVKGVGGVEYVASGNQ